MDPAMLELRDEHMQELVYDIRNRLIAELNDRMCDLEFIENIVPKNNTTVEQLKWYRDNLEVTDISLTLDGFTSSKK